MDTCNCGHSAESHREITLSVDEGCKRDIGPCVECKCKSYEEAVE